MLPPCSVVSCSGANPCTHVIFEKFGCFPIFELPVFREQSLNRRFWRGCSYLWCRCCCCLHSCDMQVSFERLTNTGLSATDGYRWFLQFLCRAKWGANSTCYLRLPWLLLTQLLMRSDLLRNGLNLIVQPPELSVTTSCVIDFL